MAHVCGVPRLPVALALFVVMVAPAARALTPEPAASGASAPVRLTLADPATGVFVDRLLRSGYAPDAQRFADAAGRLVERSRVLCAAGAPGGAPLPAARQAWVDSMLAWTRLSAVTTGPLLMRRSEPRVDFNAFRPQALDRAIAQPHATAPAAEPAAVRWTWQLDRVGSPAKGLPALEHLLWKQPPAPRTAACAYLQALAVDVHDEARGLADAFRAEAGATRSPDQAAEWFNGWANQWLSAVSRLRWREIEMPLKSWGMGQAPRAASGQTAAAWAARWAALRQQTTGGPGTPEGLQPLADYLRARGLSAPADALVREAAAVDAAFSGATPATPADRLLAASARMDVLAHVLDRQVAEQLAFQLEFSSDDGD